MSTVAVIDYGVGNLHSVAKALECVAPEGMVVRVTSDIDTIRSAERIVLPGVGAIRDCMNELQRLGLDQLVRDVVAAGEKPLLGICVGMQMLFDHSEENDGVDALGLVPGKMRFFGRDLCENGEKLKVPHMGWNRVFQQQSHPIWAGIEDGERFYFVHSYYGLCDHAESVLGRCHYGLDFDVAVTRGNLVGLQFHPEKSADAGLKLLHNFLRWTL